MYGFKRATVWLSLTVSLVSGAAFADTTIIDIARQKALNPKLTSQERGKIIEDAGDRLLEQSQRGFASDMFFEAAQNYDDDNPEGDANVSRVYQKCVDKGLKRESGCSAIRTETIDKWEANRRTQAANRPATQRSESPIATATATGTTTTSSTQVMQIDAAIRQSVAARAGAPAMIDGCPTSLEHLTDKLPLCNQNQVLLKMRELALQTDASFRADIAANYTLTQVATRNAQAARQLEEALAADEKAMLDTAASAEIVQARIKALKETPSRCDAGPPNAFGMQEAAYQAYVQAYIGVQLYRAVSAIAACRARAAK